MVKKYSVFITEEQSKSYDYYADLDVEDINIPFDDSKSYLHSIYNLTQSKDIEQPKAKNKTVELFLNFVNKSLEENGTEELVNKSLQNKSKDFTQTMFSMKSFNL